MSEVGCYLKRKQMNATETILNELISFLEKTEGQKPSSVISIHHIKDRPKKEVKELAETLGTSLITPEDNYYADCYSIQIDIKSDRILIHSTQVKFECKEVQDEE